MSDNIIEDLGVNPIEATRIMRKIGVGVDELYSPEIYGMFRDIAKFFSGYENSDYVITKVTSRANGNALLKLWEYVKLQEVRKNIEDHINKTQQEIDLIKNIPEAGQKLNELITEKAEKMKEMDSTINELKIYEN